VLYPGLTNQLTELFVNLIRVLRVLGSNAQ